MALKKLSLLKRIFRGNGKNWRRKSLSAKYFRPVGIRKKEDSEIKFEGKRDSIVHGWIYLQDKTSR